jgi:hypothetical protein
MGLFDFLGGGGKEVPKPKDIFKRTKGGKGPTMAQLQSQGLLDYYRQTTPGFVSLQKKLGPELMKQSLRESQQYLTGFKGQEGLFGLTQRAGKEAQKQIADLRARELATMSGQTGRVRNLMDRLSPEQARAIDLQQAYAERAQGLESEFQGQAAPYTGMFGTMAEEAYARRGTLSPEEQRATQQQAREAAAAAGRIGGNAAISSEIMNREAAQAARRAEAQQAAQTAYANIADVGARRQALRGEASGASGELFNRAASFYTAPGMSLLSGTPAAFGAGTGLLSAGMQGAAANTGQFDYNMPLNLALSRASAMDKRNLAQYEADAQARQSGIGALTSLASLAAIPFTGGLSAGLGLTGLAGGAAGATGLSGLGLSAGMGLKSMLGGIPRAIPV